MKYIYIKTFLVLAFIISIAFSVSSQTATTTINYSGFMSCGGCLVCGGDYWCTNTPGSYCGDTPPMIEKTFFDPVPPGNIVTNVTVNYWTASCEGAAIYGTFATSSSTSFVFPVAYDGNGGCLCSSSPCGLTTSASVSYPCGIPGYVYGGNNVFRLSSSSSMCINRAELVFSYYPASSIIPSITASGPLVICPGATDDIVLTVNSGFSGYNWNTGANTQAITVSSPGTYTVTVSSASGCDTLTASATVIAGVNPVASATAGDYCEGETGTIAALPAGMTYNWSGPNGMTGNSQSYTGPIEASTVGTYYVTVTSADGCTSTASTVLSLYSMPVVTCPANFDVCSDDSEFALSGATPVGGTYSGTGVSGGNFNPVSAGLGSHTITYTYANGPCENSCTFSILVEDCCPGINITGNTTICIGETTTLTPDPNMPHASQPWVSSNTAVATVNNSGVVTGVADGSTTITYKDVNGCTEDVVVVVSSNIEPTFSFDTEYCLNETPDVLPSTSNNSITGTWDISPISTSSVGTQDYVFTPATVGCYIPTTITVTVNNNIEPAFSFDTEYCLNETPDLLPSSSDNGINGTWDIGTISTSTAGTQDYIFTPTDAGCFIPTTITVTVNNNTESTFSFDTEYCLNETPDALPSISDNSINGTWNMSPITTSTVGTQDYIFTPTDAGCFIPTTITVTVNNNIEPSFSFETEYCLNETPDALPSASNSGVNGTWDISTITTSVVGTQDYTFTPTDVGCYIPTTITVTVHDNIEPTFSFETDYCLNDVPDALPTTSDDLINGVWSPSPIATSTVGTQDYIFTPTDVGCYIPTTVVVIVGDNTEPTFSVETEYCLNDIPDVLPSVSNNGISGTWNISPINTSSVGTQDYVFTPSSSGCFVPTTITVIVNDNIVPNFSFETEYCLNETPDILPTTSDNAVNGTWSNSSINTSVVGTQDYIFTPSDAGCYLPATITVTINDNITPTFSFDTEYCLDATAGTLPGTSNNGYTGTWSPSTIGTTTAGSDVYTFTPTAGLCATTTSVDIEIVEIELNVSMTGSVCYGEDGSFSFTASGGSGSYSYTVNGSSATSPYSAVAGTYTIGVSDGTCSSSQDITITDAESLIAYYTNTDVTCNGGNNGSIDLIVEGGTSPYSFAWNDGNVTTEDRTGLSSGIYSVVVTDVNGCSTSINNIAITQPLVVNITGVISHVACFNGSTGGVVITTIGGNAGGYTYSWSSSQQTANISGVIAGTYTVTATDSLGCTGTASFVITQPDVINVSSQLSHPVCNAQTNGGVVLTVSGGSPNYSYQWNPSGIGGSGTQNLSGVGAGVYNVTITDSHSCTSTATYTITEPSAISISETVVNTTCDLPNGSISIVASGGTPQYSYQWGANAMNATTPMVSYLTDQDYLVTITDENQCTFVDTISVGYDIPPSLSLVEQFNETCSDTNAIITVEVTDGSPLFTYEWSVDLGHNSPTISNISAGNHGVTVTDSDGCVDSLTVVITNHEAQEVGVAAIIPAHCDQFDGGARLEVIGGSGSYTYDWGTSPPRTSIHETDLSGGFYTVTVSDGVCDVEVIVDVPNLPGPTVNASANPNEVFVSKAFVRFNDGSTGATSWNWDFDNGQYSINQTPTFKYEIPGTYSVVLTVTDDYGCIASDTFIVIVLEDLAVWIPNAFTPDKDGLNELFGPIASGMSSDGYEMVIFDRWGKQAFISNDYHHRWDGTINGKKVVTNAVFVYRIVIYDTMGKDFIFTGRISVIYGFE